MTNCKEFAALLDLYVDGELSFEEMCRVRDHLDTCPACRAYVDDALAIRAAFPDVEDTVVPNGFAEGVMAAVRQSGAPVRRTPWKKLLLPLAACFAVAVLVLPLRDTLSGGAKMERASSTAAPAMAASLDTAAAESAPAEPEEAPAAEAPAAYQERPMEYATAYQEEPTDSKKMGADSGDAGTVAPDSDFTEPAAGQTEEAAPETMIMTASKQEPAACVTLPVEGLQLELLAGRTPDRESENQVEFGLTLQEYDTLLAQLDESGLDYTAEESATAGSDTVLVIVKTAN